jgi:hypothetical protein
MTVEGRPEPTKFRSANGWNRRFSPGPLRSREGPLTEPTAGAQRWLGERVLCP